MGDEFGDIRGLVIIILEYARPLWENTKHVAYCIMSKNSHYPWFYPKWLYVHASYINHV
jgi:hypothetical protein